MYLVIVKVKGDFVVDFKYNIVIKVIMFMNGKIDSE